MPFPLKLNDSHRRLVSLIRRHQPVPRANLGKLSGLGSGPVTQITRDLLLAGLIREGERIRGGRGQPALPLMLDPAGALSFGVSMIPGKLRIVAIDFAGTMVEQTIAAMPDNGPLSVAGIIGAQIDQICKKVRLHDRNRILGVGFALPGFFFGDHEHMRVVDEHASWRQEPLSELFARALDVPCWIENDATAAAMAEYYQQPGETNALITLLVNYGIGSGLVLAGQPFRGGHGNAGEVGAFYPLDRPRPSGTDLLKRLQAEGVELRGLTDIDYTDPRHRAVCDIWSRDAGTQLRDLIASAWSWLDPERIVLSGPLPPALLQRLVADIGTDSIFAQHPDRPAPQVVPSTLGAEVAALGAAHIPLHAFTGQMGTI
ncbi:ROK family protein [Sphingomonas koreensis]|jgi:predicted NBD/HSP70 family sugar kinase|uniref:ROK family protein n=1 Tax=Sphingomonas koreensis TaxID=93064 RepID=A0A1L6JDG9_9SPHN|nr:ROK family protein [Sphingomonas koreensis]APR53976.1 hypothetical protein BRX40_17550 [Sphingomonas koreensis]MDC7808936.1 ROK family protein [Sphingomonas koreensis]RSU19043.1 ROK family protein [Sphingomonas koreensis]RSU24119.1 ROK family protein [Sphingomonas koreensis]RSU26369.1 ROK family protein [Sphingomonas koreensis]